MEDKEDWVPWWKFWCDGYNVAIRDMGGTSEVNNWSTKDDEDI